ncbi:MAG: ribosome recycling factor [candidate division Zixibacteria bacterium]|nr:ribosome recycling factor [candidate division Zixibacteria bacterium]MDH3939022.1 ribosome recycling factor [candidate division Zixibacteria bacterium]MDH4035377.1 ribosome recycling factor [candidate division Zixibacteria bacterium]
MLDAIYKESRERMAKSVESVQREFGAVRTGKATVHLLDTVTVEAYGASMPLNQVATVTVPEPRLLVVQAFDKGTVGEIVKGIQKADLGFNPVVDGQIIRIPVPALNEERRKELVRHCHNLAEEGRIAIRNIRRDANDHIKKAQKDKEISEDQERDGLNEVQKMTGEYSAQVDALLEAKEADVLEV